MTILPLITFINTYEGYDEERERKTSIWRGSNSTKEIPIIKSKVQSLKFLKPREFNSFLKNC